MDFEQQCEEYYHAPIDMNALMDEGNVIFISEHLMFVARQVDGKLLGAAGTVVKAETCEMNTVKVTRGDEVLFFELSDNVRWFEPELGGIN